MTGRCYLSLASRLERDGHPEALSGCVLWHGSLDQLGYGLISDGGHTRKAHRVAYALRVGPIPEGMDVLHSCDVRACVNPDHLRVGTHLENMRDMVARGRHRPRGRARPAVRS